MSEQPLRYEPIAVSAESTVVAEFVPEASTISAYQSEAQLEAGFIAQLQTQAYEYLPVSSEAQLVANLRAQLEMLNGLEFTDAEWSRFFTESIAGERDGIVEKTRRIQDDHVQVLKRDDGSTKNVRLIDKQNVHNNRLQVINQYELPKGGPSTGSASGGNYAGRYDVTILVNGLPLVHVELKRRGVDIREAFNQISRYQRDSFWAGSGLFEYVQLFVISNGTLTKYYSNTTRTQHLRDAAGSSRVKKTSNSFEFTSWWADANNRPIQDLGSFTKTFFAKHAILNILTRYCVFTAEQMLLVMRPYQIVATERILQRIDASTNSRRLGTISAGGYIWHTTGSGKTLTSFKTAQLATRMPGVEKVLFVVDRKDLDYQTMKEYDRFQKGAANSNTSTRVLKRQLEDPGARIIITTIQKLSTFVAKNKGHSIYDGHIVIVFDECHRSQFGDMHTAIKKAFKRYHLFGFTGTPIFAANSGASRNPKLRTTEQAFGDKLHTYTIVDAISDKNVLPFRIDYLNTAGMAPGVVDKDVAGIQSEEALLDTERIARIVAYIREHFDQKTKRNASYALGQRRVRGFNSILATASIEAARRYYTQFQIQQSDLPTDQQLKIAMIYSYAPNGENEDGLLAEEEFETYELGGTDRDVLEAAIQDYNDLFKQSFDTSGDQFGNYYRDLSMRLKNREVDLVIVVNMFLTGFDATTLNTLWVDKNLKQHGLIQAFSRTNRILNSVKTYGNVVCFRNLEQATNDAIALFGNKDAGGVVLMKPYAEYYADYAERVNDLLMRFPLTSMPIVGESDQKAFIALFGAILRLRNILQAFDEFESDGLLSPAAVQDYQSHYLDLYREFRKIDDGEKESIHDDVVFEIELVKQVEINVDYILMLVKQYQQHLGDGVDKEIRVQIDRAIDASLTLRSKKDLLEEFIDGLTVSADVDENWRAFMLARREEELDRLIAEESLKPEETREFVARALREGRVETAGTAITRILPPVSRFSASGGHAEKKQTVIAKLSAYIERFFGLA